MLTAAILACGLLSGGMLFFAAITAPVAFRSLSSEAAGTYIRAVFPVYYLYAAVLAVLAALFALWVSPLDGAVLAVVALGFVLARQLLMPAINRSREAREAGDAAAAARFSRLHRLSVLLNMLQLAASLVVLIHLTL
jgi:hypothetical protein